jgi:hypothetical protein
MKEVLGAMKRATTYNGTWAQSGLPRLLVTSGARERCLGSWFRRAKGHKSGKAMFTSTFGFLDIWTEKEVLGSLFSLMES